MKLRQAKKIITARFGFNYINFQGPWKLSTIANAFKRAQQRTRLVMKTHGWKWDEVRGVWCKTASLDARTAFEATKHVHTLNDADWNGLQSGTVFFGGIEARPATNGSWETTFMLSVSSNVTNGFQMYDSEPFNELLP